MMRTRQEQIIDQYIKTLLEECGEKNPMRRQAFEEDIWYALQVTEPFIKRYSEALRYDIYAVDSRYEKAITVLKDAVGVLERFGIDVVLPERIENPWLIEAECVMALVDMLRSLEALSKTGAGVFVEEVMKGLFRKTDAGQSEKRAPEPKIADFIRRYIDETIPESVLDKIAFDEGYLEKYLAQL